MTVDQLKTQRESNKNLFNSYVKRRDAVKNIISNIDNKLDDDVRDVNFQISLCISELSQGLKGVSNVLRISSDMTSAKESSASSESRIVSCKSSLNEEVSRCQREINALDSEIKQLESQIKAQGGTIHFWE